MYILYMLWFKFIIGWIFFKSVGFLFQTGWKRKKKNSNYKIHGLYYALNIQWTAGDITTLWFILIWAKWVCFTVLLSAEVLSRTQSGSIVWKHQKWILCHPGPIVSIGRVVQSYFSTRRPSNKAAQEAMAALGQLELVLPYKLISW